MKRVDFWATIKPGDDSPWIKLPSWGVSALRKFGINDSEITIILFLVSRIDESLDRVNAPTRSGMEYTQASSCTYYRGINKLKQLGLRKVGNGFYDMTELVANLRCLIGAKEETND